MVLVSTNHQNVKGELDEATIKRLLKGVLAEIDDGEGLMKKDRKLRANLAEDDDEEEKVNWEDVSSGNGLEDAVHGEEEESDEDIEDDIESFL